MDFYEECSKIVATARNKKGSMKNLIYKSDSKRKKTLFALVSETIKCYEKLQEIVNRCSQLQKEPKLRADRCLLAVLLYEHVMGHGVRGKYKSLLMKHKTSIHAACERMKVKHGVISLKQLLTPDNTNEHPIPKYVRVNTLKTTLSDVKREMKDFNFIQASKADFQSCVQTLLTQSTVIEDPDIPDLLVFHPSTDLHLHPLYTSGAIILQDKASCTPAYVLSPPPGSTVIDCCAAPGNKTTQLAALLNNTGKINAFDRDRVRLETLKKMVLRAGATCITASCCDFLTVDPAQYTDVEYILVDPSCSGSGIVGRHDGPSEDSDMTARLKQLSAFQCTILKHALSFPSVKRVVYSTCSIHEAENEQVVEQVLDHVREKFDIETILPNWSYRGMDAYKHGARCIRMSPEKTLTNGFFVSCFVRKNTEGDVELGKGLLNDKEERKETSKINGTNHLNQEESNGSSSVKRANGLHKVDRKVTSIMKESSNINKLVKTRANNVKGTIKRKSTTSKTAVAVNWNRSGDAELRKHCKHRRKELTNVKKASHSHSSKLPRTLKATSKWIVTDVAGKGK